MDHKIDRPQRVCVQVPVIITTVLDVQEATLVDLTEDGGLISGCSLSEGTRFQIDYMSETIYAQSIWHEVDRTGCRFIFPLRDGALYQHLELARSALFAESAAFADASASPIRGFGRRLA
ncbi:hypothetical protein M2336_003229 [Sphingobium sp. B1D7B]|uniref:PilZ domain-containing protein n=1 Tax=unclassified Sphingobium TaxID=2611147 RepID=UPI0022244D84|nr:MULTISPECIES: PilZ domain-containing protein [unclassified Sphingobium]MCW2391389.1 hypothetical protein [Sphingobium sp. B11D3A]MCW2406600.1 hypothetical protein [Sphingobium sp. B1D7B]